MGAIFKIDPKTGSTPAGKICPTEQDSKNTAQFLEAFCHCHKGVEQSAANSHLSTKLSLHSAECWKLIYLPFLSRHLCDIIDILN